MIMSKWTFLHHLHLWFRNVVLHQHRHHLQAPSPHCLLLLVCPLPRHPPRAVSTCTLLDLHTHWYQNSTMSANQIDVIDWFWASELTSTRVPPYSHLSLFSSPPLCFLVSFLDVFSRFCFLLSQLPVLLPLFTCVFLPFESVVSLRSSPFPFSLSVFLLGLSFDFLMLVVFAFFRFLSWVSQFSFLVSWWSALCLSICLPCTSVCELSFFSFFQWGVSKYWVATLLLHFLSVRNKSCPTLSRSRQGNACTDETTAETAREKEKIGLQEGRGRRKWGRRKKYS